MSDTSLDRRIIRTRRMIRDALTELMEEKGFEGITVSDLTAKADINRGTFYLHYHDKFDLLQQSEDEIVKDLEKIVEPIERLSPDEAWIYHQQNEPFPFLLKLFEYMLENSSFMRVMLGPKGDPSFQVKLKELIKKNLLKNLEKKLKKDDMIVPAEYLVAYVSSAHLGVLQHWLESGMAKPPREVSLVLSRITLLGPGNILGLEIKPEQFGRMNASLPN